jgi:hypothetical protein
MRLAPDLGFRFAAGMLLAVLLTACGGGSADGSSNGVVVAQDTVRLACNVKDKVTNAAVAGAKVTYQSGTTEFATTTDTAGNCVLDLPSSEVAGVPYPAASVAKAGYEPQTILYSKFEGGKYYPQTVLLVPQADNLSLPVGGEIVMHLGDDKFEGTANSQFQKQTDGVELEFAIDDWAAQVQKGYTKATVNLDAKGWETNVCKNLVSLVGRDMDGNVVSEVSLPGGTSPADGYWAGGKQVPFNFSVAAVGAERVSLRVTAGACGGTADLDDFEINRIRVYFCSGDASCQ